MSLENVQVHVQGDAGGQIAVGDYNLLVQIGDVRGGVVNVMPPEARPQLQPRPGPASLLPRPFTGLLDRESEVQAAVEAFQFAAPLAFYGEAGLGKSVLLRHLAYHSATNDFADGVIHLSAAQRPVPDVLQFLWAAFFDVGGGGVAFKPTAAQIRQGLQDKQALVFLDDVEWAREEVETLLDAAPRCSFVLASSKRLLWGEGRAAAMRGLPLQDAVRLVEQELGRPLTAEESPVAGELCTILAGHPLRILQAVAMIHEAGHSLAQVVGQLKTPSPFDALSAQVLISLSETEKQVLAVLSVLDGVPLSPEQVAALTGLSDVSAIMETLEQRRVIQAHSPRYTLTGTMGQELAQMWDLTAWAEQALLRVMARAEQNRSQPKLLLQEADIVLRMLEWGVRLQRWEDVLRLTRAIEGALAMGVQWGAWYVVLEQGLQAARALGDRAGEGWALHQLGTRDMCLENTAAAKASLTEALRIRQALGDRAGAEVTRHNLDLLAPPPPAEPPESPPEPPPEHPPEPDVGRQKRPPKPAGVSPLLVGVAILVVVGVVAAGIWGAWWLLNRPSPQPRVEPRQQPYEREIEVPAEEEERAEPVEPSLSHSVSIVLHGGCDREYAYGDQTRLLIEGSVAGQAELQVNDDVWEVFELDPARPWSRTWTFEDLQPGENVLRVVLRSADGEPLAQDACSFTLVKR